MWRPDIMKEHRMYNIKKVNETEKYWILLFHCCWQGFCCIFQHCQTEHKKKSPKPTNNDADTPP